MSTGEEMDMGVEVEVGLGLTRARVEVRWMKFGRGRVEPGAVESRFLPLKPSSTYQSSRSEHCQQPTAGVKQAMMRLTQPSPSL